MSILERVTDGEVDVIRGAVKFFERSDPAKWITGYFHDGGGNHCALGHIEAISINSSFSAREGFRTLVFRASGEDVADWNNQYSHRGFKNPKEAVLGLLMMIIEAYENAKAGKYDAHLQEIEMKTSGIEEGISRGGLYYGERIEPHLVTRVFSALLEQAGINTYVPEPVIPKVLAEIEAMEVTHAMVPA